MACRRSPPATGGATGVVSAAPPAVAVASPVGASVAGASVVAAPVVGAVVAGGSVTTGVAVPQAAGKILASVKTVTRVIVLRIFSSSRDMVYLFDVLLKISNKTIGCPMPPFIFF